MTADTLFLRLEGPMQAWGVQESKFAVRRSAEAPTKSGVFGLLCAALGVSRGKATADWLPKFGAIRMGVRIDVPGVRWWDYHTVGAELDMRIAEGEGKTKPGALLSRREYLCDASFLVALRGEPDLVADLGAALRNPKWALYLGRKSCPPSRPVHEHASGSSLDLLSALTAIPWRRRLASDAVPASVTCLVDWDPTPTQPEAPADAEVWYDVPLTFEPPAHRPRFVVRREAPVGADGGIAVADQPAQSNVPAPPRPRADYANSEYKRRRRERLASDQGLCVFCKSPATTVQHITYRRAGGDEAPADLRSLCRLCHDAITMIEYGENMGLDRINPEEPRWRDRIVKKREEITRFRSLETRRRRLSAEEV